MGIKEFDNVQLDVEFTKATKLENLTSKENIGIAFGKLARWFDELGNGGITLSKTGSGNAFTDATFVNGELTLTKGSTFLTTHPAITKSNDTTSSESPAHGGSFTVIDAVTREGNGHVTKINTKTVTLPAGYTHPTYTARTGKPTGNQTPAFGGTFTISQITSDTTGHVTGATDRTVTIPATTMGPATADAAGTIGLVPAPAKGKQTAFLRGDGTWIIPTNTTYSAGTGLDLSGTTFNHSNSVAAVTTAGFLKLKYDAQGHITGTTAVTKDDITGLGIPTSDTNTTYTLSGAYGTNSNTWVTTLTPSTGSATTSTVPTASTSVYGITKLSSATNSTSTALAATASAVKSAYDLANGKSTVSFTASLTSGTKVGTIVIDGTSTDLYCQTNTNTDTKVTATKLAASTASASYLPTFVSAAGTNGVSIMDSFGFRHTVGTADAQGNSRLVLGNSTAKGTANNEEGYIVLYTPGTGYATLHAAESSSNSTHYLPTTGGTLLNTGTTSFTASLTSGTKIGSIKINNTTTDIYCQTNTDAKVKQSATTSSSYRPLLLGYTNTTTVADLSATVTDQAYVTANLYTKPSAGAIYATTFYGALSGNASSATQVYSTLVDPETDSTYYMAFHSTNSSANKSLLNNNGIRYNVKNGTAADGGYSVFILGNATAEGTVGNKRGQLRLYGTNTSYVQLRATASTTAYTVYLPAGNGTLVLDNHTHNYAGSASAGGSATTVQGTLTNPATSTTYYIPFHSGVSTGAKTLLNNNGIRYITLEGTTTALGHGLLALGNGVASGTDANKYGYLRIYGKGTGYTNFIPLNESASNYTINIPAAGGTMALTKDLDGYLPLTGGTLTGKLQIYTTAATTAMKSSQLVIGTASGDTANGGNVAIELFRGANASWQIINESGTLRFRHNYTTAKQTAYSDALSISYNTGNAKFTGAVTCASTTESSSKSTGGTIVSGGLGVAKAIWAGGVIHTDLSFYCERTSTGGGFMLRHNEATFGQWYISTMPAAGTSSTAGTQGVVILTLGNSTAVDGTGSTTGAENARGNLRIYGTGTTYIALQVGNPEGSKTLTLPPTSAGWVVGTSTTAATGSASLPVYINASGQATAITTLGVANGGTGKTSLSDVTVGTANKLGTNAGSATLPVYFSGGVPVATTAPKSGAWWSSFTGAINSSGVLEIGRYVDFHSTNAGTSNFDVRLDASSTSLLTMTSDSGTPQFCISGTLPRLRFTQTTTDKAYSSASCGITVQPANTSGTNMLIQSGGNMVIGGGEFPANIYTRALDSVNGTGENMYIGADNNIYLYTNAGSINTADNNDHKRWQLSTGGHTYLPTSGQIRYNNSGFEGILTAATLKEGVTWTLPAAKGTIALTSDLSKYLPLAGGTMTGNIIMTSSSVGIQVNMKDTSNYGTTLRWYIGGVSGGAYNPSVGFHTTGGDGNGAIIILPYATDTDPWGKNVGLYIGKGMLKLDGTDVSLSGHKHAAGDITSGTLSVARGGTGAGTFTTNAVLCGNTTSAIKAVATANGAAYATAANGALTFGTLPVAQGGTGQTTAQNAANAFLNALGTASSTPQDADYYISQYAGGGTTTTTYHRRPLSALWTWIYGHLYQNITSSTDSWETIGVPLTSGFVLKVVRGGSGADAPTPPAWFSERYGAGLVFGGADSKALISMTRTSRKVVFAGGSNTSTVTSPQWYFGITGASGTTYDLSTFSASGHTHNYAGSSSAGGAATTVQATLHNPTSALSLVGIPFFSSTPSTAGKTIYTNNGLRYSTLEGTTDALGYGMLVLGNGVGSGTTANKYGYIRMYGKGTGYTNFIPLNDTESNYTINIPAFGGTMALTRNTAFYGTCSTAAGTVAKTVAASGFVLATGAKIIVKFTATNTAANPTLNVNSTGAKPIFYRGAAISAGYLANKRVYTFVYDGTNYELIGDVNTNSSVTVTGLKIGSTSGNHNLIRPLLFAASTANPDNKTETGGDMPNGRSVATTYTGGANMTGLAFIETNYWTNGGPGGQGYAIINASGFKILGEGGAFYGDLSGTATRAISDKDGNNIHDTYAPKMVKIYKATSTSTSNMSSSPLTIKEDITKYEYLILTISVGGSFVTREFPAVAGVHQLSLFGGGAPSSGSQIKLWPSLINLSGSGTSYSMAVNATAGVKVSGTTWSTEAAPTIYIYALYGVKL